MVLGTSALNCHSRGARYRADSMGDKAEPCPTPTSTSKNGESSRSQEYCVVRPTKYDRKNSTTSAAKPILARKYRMASWLREGKKYAQPNATPVCFNPLAYH